MGRVLDNAGRVCNVCRSTEHIQVHHRTYVNLGNELDRDLQALCKFCHENEHEGKVDGVMDPMTARYLALGI
jgi:5-methylcytosine-specific restriction endonuclease McrA